MACSATTRTHSINLERKQNCADPFTLMCKLLYNFNIWNFFSVQTKTKAAGGIKFWSKKVDCTINSLSI